MPETPADVPEPAAAGVRPVDVPADGAEGEPPVMIAWSRLPESVRSRIAEAASVAVGAMPVDDVPVPLRRLARFTPAKRTRLGRPALLAELEASGVFRTAVVAWWEEHRAGE